MFHQPTVVVSDLTFTEGPRWHDGRLWFSDLYSHRVLSVLEDGTDLRVEAVVPHQPSGLDWLPDGSLLVISMYDQTLLRREPSGELVVHADLRGRVAGCLNDLAVDRWGRAYVGDFGFDLYAEGETMRRASIHRIDPDGTITKAAGDMWFPNGCVITGDDVLLVNETFGNRISAFDVTPSGELANRRVWAGFGPLPQAEVAGEAMTEVAVAPDGMCLDAEGALWVADIRNERLLRLIDGEVVDEISVGSCVFAPVLGGADGRTLFLCATPVYDVETCKSQHNSSIVAVRVDVPAAGVEAGR